MDNTLAKIEEIAFPRLTRTARSYYSSGGNAMVSLRANKADFENIKLRRAVEVNES